MRNVSGNVRKSSLVWIGVGIRILGEVKGQDLTDNAVSLLLLKETDTDRE